MKIASIAALTVNLAAAWETVSVDVSQPQNNAPLNTSLAYYRLRGFNGEDEYLTHGTSTSER